MEKTFNHIVVLMLENHSFDRVLGWMQPKYKVNGVDPAHPKNNPDPAQKAVQQNVTRAASIAADPKHEYHNVQMQLSDGNSGFVLDFANNYPEQQADWPEVMGWYDEDALPIIHFLAKNFVVCDKWFSSVPGPTWPNRLFALSGTSLGHVDMPEGITDLGLHIYDQETIFTELSRNKVTWGIYYGDIPMSLLLMRQWEHPFGYRPYAQFVTDVQSGDLPEFVWIEPHYFGTEQNDQHPTNDIRHGEALIAEVYEALRANPSLFEDTLFIVTYDEHGGFYDHVEPPGTVAPESRTDGAFKFDHMGARVPTVLISPRLEQAVLSEVFDHANFSKLTAENWGVRTLGNRAAAAKPLLTNLKMLTPRQMPAAPKVFPPPAPAVSGLPNGHQKALLALSHRLDEAVTDPAIRTALAQNAAQAVTPAHPRAGLVRARVQAFLEQHRTTRLTATPAPFAAVAAPTAAVAIAQTDGRGGPPGNANAAQPAAGAPSTGGWAAGNQPAGSGRDRCWLALVIFLGVLAAVILLGTKYAGTAPVSSWRMVQSIKTDKQAAIVLGQCSSGKCPEGQSYPVNADIAPSLAVLQTGDAIAWDPPADNQQLPTTLSQAKNKDFGVGPRLAVMLAGLVLVLLAASIPTCWQVWRLVIGLDNHVSNSTAQMALWFAMALTVYLATVMARVMVGGWDFLGGVAIPPNLLALSGLSALTFVAARAATVQKVADAQSSGNAQAVALKDPKQNTPSIKDLVQNDRGQVDIGDFQMIFITFITVVVYVLQVYNWLGSVSLSAHVELPDVDSTMLAAFSIGQGAYLAKKAASSLGQG